MRYKHLVSYRKGRVSELRGGVERALAALELAPDAPAEDGWLDPGALTAALEGEDDVLLRAGGDLAEEAGYAAVPEDPLWLVVGRGAAMRACGLRAAEPRGETAARVAAAREVVSCCDQPKCKDEKTIARVWIETEAGAHLTVAEGVDDLAPLAAALAARLEVPCDLPQDAATTRAAREETPHAALSAQALARWALRREGELFVVRDHASRGPREAAWYELAGAGAMIAGGVVAWIAAASAWSAASYQALTIAAIIGLVLTLAAWATFHIGLHSARYRAASEALLYAARDRLVLAPWHSRSGAVDVKPEGRYGAALRLGELERLEVVEERDGFTLRAHSSHGLYDIGTLESADQAELWRRVLGALASRVAHGAMASRVAHGALVLLFALAGCTPPPSPPPAPHDDPAPVPQPTAGKALADPPLEIIEDDVPRAMSKAKASGKVVFVEVWAPWCHTCLSMKSFVLPDPALRPLGKRVVFAAIDGDRPENAAFMSEHSVGVWPTLFVLDAQDGAVLALWQGSASVGELRDFITGAVDERDAELDPAGPLAAMRAAKQAEARGDLVVAAGQYAKALERGGASWNRKSEALIGLLFAYARQKDWERCAKLGAERIDEVEGAAVPADFSAILLGCAAKVDSPALKEQVRERAMSRLRRHIESTPAAASVDDRSDALAILADALEESGDKDGAKNARLRQLEILETAAAAAPGPKEASTFDYARMNVYLALGQGDKAVALLTQRTKDQPDNYEPFARLAQTLIALERFSEAQEPAAGAVARAYGPRKLRYIAYQITIAKKLGDPASERSALVALLAAYDALTPAQQGEARNKEQADQARARLAELAKARN
jgi:thioredoxin-like negative regulator of GroEL